MLETCLICEKTDDTVADKLCESCEPEFMNSIEYLGKTVPRETKITELFKIATNLTQARYFYQSKKAAAASTMNYLENVPGDV